MPPLTLAEYCAKYRISRMTAHRLIQKGELCVVDRRRSQHGKPALLVEAASPTLAHSQKHKPVWVRFQQECEKEGHHPGEALARYLHGSDFDPDLLHAAIRLTFYSYFQKNKLAPMILKHFYRKERVGGDRFSAFVAHKLREAGRPSPNLLKASRQMPFREFWHRSQNAVVGWTLNVRPCETGSPYEEQPGYKLVLKPRYRDEHQYTLPMWSAESVRTVSSKFTRYAGLYQKEIQRLAEAVLVRRQGKVRFNREGLRLSDAAIRAALAGDLNPGLTYLKELGISSALAKSYLRAWQSRQKADLKLTRADVRRVFCIGIRL